MVEHKGLNSAPEAGRDRPRRLLLCLDGVPFEVLEAAKGRGLFDNFRETARLLSPFPTMTNVALSCMLKATAPLGYESLYFDRQAQELRGGVSKYIGWRTPDKSPSSYMDELDYQEPLPFEFLVYVAPETIWRADMRRFHEKFLRAPRTRDFFAFLKGTDGLLHIRGRKRLDVALRSLDRILRDVAQRCGTETEIVLFSDHGMNLEENRRVPLREYLRRRGMSVTESLRGRAPSSVALPAFGLCGYAALYCRDDEAAANIASALVELKGVDFTIHREGASAIAVRSLRGAAHIHQKSSGEKKLYRYEQSGGDPLKLAEVVRAIEEDGAMDGEGYAPDEAWYERTADHIYPDALSNLYEAMHGARVRHTADVLVSFEDGHYYGSYAFSRFVRLAATHGNALRASSTAFMMSTHRTLPAFVRANEAYPFLLG